MSKNATRCNTDPEIRSGGQNMSPGTLTEQFQEWAEENGTAVSVLASILTVLLIALREI